MEGRASLFSARRLRRHFQGWPCHFGWHRWAYTGEGVAKPTPWITHRVNEFCLDCEHLRFNPDSVVQPGDWRRKPKPDGGQIHA